MKTKNLFTSLAAAVMLSAGLAGAGVSAAEPVHAATTQTQKGIGLQFRSVSATVNSDKPVLLTLKSDNQSFEKTDSTYTKGQAVNVYYSVDVTVTSPSGQKQSITLYCIKIGSQTEAPVFISSTEVTTSAKIPTREDWMKQRENDVKTVQDAFNKVTTKYIVITPKSKKGAKIYYAYKKSAKAKKVYFKTTKKKIKYGKKLKAVSPSEKVYQPIVKVGKKKYVYIGKKRYLNWSNVKIVSAKYTSLQLSDELKDMLVEN